MKYLFLLTIWITTCTSVVAQEQFFQGRVLDYNNDEPLPLATVYLNNTTIGTTTDLDGYFSLAVDGSYDELIVSFVGYEVITHIIKMDELENMYIFKLRPSQHILAETIIKDKRSASWYGNLEFFTRYFLGETASAQKTKILNPEVLYFSKSDTSFHAFAREPIVLENKYLGYRIHYLLASFDYNYDQLLLINLGYPRFELLEGNKRKQRRWERSRDRVYKGSMQDFLHTLCSEVVTASNYEVRQVRLKESPSSSRSKAMRIIPKN